MRKLAKQADLTWQGLKDAQSLLTNTVSEPGETEVNRVVKSRNNAKAKDNSRVKDSSFQAWKKGWQQVSGGPCAYHSYYRTKARSCIPPCSAAQSGKRQRRPPVALSTAGINQLFYIDDTSSKRRFLVDTR